MTKEERWKFGVSIITFLELFLREAYGKRLKDNFFNTIVHLSNDSSYQLSIETYNLVDEVMSLSSEWYSLEDFRISKIYDNLLEIYQRAFESGTVSDESLGRMYIICETTKDCILRDAD
jgi:hypothetical protein